MAGTESIGGLIKFLFWVAVTLVLLGFGAVTFWAWIWRDGFM